MKLRGRPLSKRVFGRSLGVFAADVGGAYLSLQIALHLRLDSDAADAMLASAGSGLLAFTIIAAAVFLVLRTYERTWRFTSFNDVLMLGAASGLAILLFQLWLATIGRIGWLPRSTPYIQWLVLMTELTGMRAGRKIAASYLRGALLPPVPSIAAPGLLRPTLLVGAPDRVELLLRQLELSSKKAFRPVGILDPHGALSARRVRGVPVVGADTDLKVAVERLEAEGERPQCLLYADRVDRLGGPAMVRLVTDAQALRLDVACLQDPTGYQPGAIDALDVQYLDPTDLLGRPQATLSLEPVARVIAGRRILVTGAGGTIGRELARQIAGFGPAQLLLLDGNEFNLYEVDLELRDNHPGIARVPLLCSIRQRAQVMQLFRIHRPEIVFHAAALKHVPLVEAHPSAGIQTNVLGTRNVADAAREFGALAMVQVSTDKAVNPVGFMGVTKRLGELYCQALDLAGAGEPAAPRFMTVRFGNVVGSSGSLIPLFQRQLSRGGPLTVTHPEIERFFMTVHEAVQLVLHSAACGLQEGATRGRIFVLDMGAPIRVIEIARRMIRLAGLEPDDDVKIEIVGLRPGEKLFEELFDTEEERLPATAAGIMEAESRPLALDVLNDAFDRLATISARGDDPGCSVTARAVIALTRRRPQEIISFAPADAAMSHQLARQAG